VWPDKRAPGVDPSARFQGRPAHVEFRVPEPIDPVAAKRAHGALLEQPGVVVARVMAVEGRILIGYEVSGTSPAVLAAMLCKLGLAPEAVTDRPSCEDRARDTCC
jgi:hypothetical protein